MRSSNVLRCIISFGSSVGVCAATYAADNCTGTAAAFSLTSETTELAKGHSLTVFSNSEILFSENSPFDLTTGTCAGTSLTTPDGATKLEGHCVRHNKEGDTVSIDWAVAPGAPRGSWKLAGGTGKFSKMSGSGWFEFARADGKMSATKWGGTCN